MESESNLSSSNPSIITESSPFKFEKGKIYYLIIYGLVSSGKSTFFDSIQTLLTTNPKYQSLFNLTIVSSDDIRESLTAKYQLDHPNLSHDECFDKVGKQTAVEFDKKINEFKHNKSKEKINVVLVDKNYPQGIDRFCNTFLDVDNEENDNIVINILPNIPKDACINIQNNYYPFSMSYIIQCYLRLKNRKGHQNLDGGSDKSNFIFFSFLKLFKGFNIMKKLKGNINRYKGGIYVKYVSFTDEEKEIDYKGDENLSHFICKCMKNLRAFDMYNIEEYSKKDIDFFVDYICAEFDVEGRFKGTLETIQKEVEELFARIEE